MLFPCCLVLAFLSLEHPNPAQKSDISYYLNWSEPRCSMVAGETLLVDTCSRTYVYVSVTSDHT